MMTESSENAAAKARGPLSVEVTPEGVAVITYDVPGHSMNTLQADFIVSFGELFERVISDRNVVAAVLISGKKDSFIAGADLKMLDKVVSRDDALAISRQGHEALARLNKASKPFVAAIHGAALGGGMEVALACHARVMSDSSKTHFALPEVQIGLLPGLNGLQRLAQLTSVQVALDYGLTGKKMRARKARKLGVADDVVPRPILLQVASELALKLAKSGRKPKKKNWLSKSELMKLALEKNPLGRRLLFSKARQALRKKTGGHYPAPERIVDVLECFANDGFEASQRIEAESFAELLQSEVAANLMSIFFATTALKKDNGCHDPSVKARTVEKMGMLGAGLMGAGIAYVSVDKGIDVRLKDRDDAGLARGVKYITDIFDTRVKRRRLDPSARASKLARLSTTLDYRGISHVPLIIEAVFEDLALKHRVLTEVEEACDKDVIFASNTSSLPISRIAEVAKRPENVVGMHYFSPVHKMPLLEVIRTERTSDEVVATAVAVGKRQGKTVIVVNDGVGFYTSRVLGPYMNEASYLLTEGCSVEEIDQAMMRFGWPVGPMTLIDEVGIDVAAHVGPIMVEAFGGRMTPPATVSRLVEDGRKGRKNGRGFYLYGAAAKKKGKGKHVDMSVYQTLGLNIPNSDGPSAVSMEEIQQRCNLQFLNEAMHCWGEGILRSPRDGDIGAIFGLGFPPFLGGPFRYIDKLGAATVLTQIEQYQSRFGERWAPAPALVEMATSGKRFY